VVEQFQRAVAGPQRLGLSFDPRFEIGVHRRQIGRHQVKSVAQHAEFVVADRVWPVLEFIDFSCYVPMAAGSVAVGLLEAGGNAVGLPCYCIASRLG
jgi:hypothetical protein